MRALLLIALAACSGPDDKDTPATDADTDGTADTDTDLVSETDTDPDTDTDTNTPTDVEFASLCGAEPTFSDPGATEYLQWTIGGVENVARPFTGGIYVYNGNLSVSLYDGTTFAALGFGAIAGIGERLAAGTYTCTLADPQRFFVNAGSLGQASSDFPSSSCLLRFDQEVYDGGTLEGALTAQLSDFNGTQTNCVDARFYLVDAPP